MHLSCFARKLTARDQMTPPSLENPGLKGPDAAEQVLAE